MAASSSRSTTPLLSCALKVDERIVEYLHGSDDIDAALSPFARHVRSAKSLDSLLLPQTRKERLAHLFSHADTGDLVVYLQAPPGHGKQTLAEALAASIGKTLLVVDGHAVASAPIDTAIAIVRNAIRESRLLDAALYWDHFDALFVESHEPLRAVLLDAVNELPGPTFFAGAGPWEPTDALLARRFLRIDVDLLSSTEQAILWKTALGNDDGIDSNVDLHAIVNRYRLSGGQIRDAAATARSMALFRNPEEPRVNEDELSSACRFHANRRLSTLARKVDSTGSWDDLVLSKDRLERLREICNHARYRSTVFDTWGFGRKLTSGKGLALMFAGPPGTGKTMAAGVMARELGLDLYQIDLAGVVSKYIGETEKHLARIFSEAEQSRAMLFFDEADALFGKRTEIKDAHDRFANIEISYLLQRIEAYEGVVVLATNFSRNIDDAFVRRIQFIVEFSLPEEKERLAIWERMFPPTVPRAPGLDLPFMARQFELAGGNIRNIAVAAAFLAASEASPVLQKHLLHATRREYQKMSRVIDDGKFVYRARELAHP